MPLLKKSVAKFYGTEFNAVIAYVLNKCRAMTRYTDREVLDGRQQIILLPHSRS